jgi:hypothetical protein
MSLIMSLIDALGNPIEGPNNGNLIRLHGGPKDGHTVYYRGGIMVEIQNPDLEKWGPTDRLAYAYEIENNELVGVFPQ